MDGIHWTVTSDKNFYQNNNAATTTGLEATANPNDIWGVAVDMGNNAIWFRLNGGNWNNNVSDNPATNTGGISISPMNTSGTLWAEFYINNTDALTVNFGASAYNNSAPSGFGNW